MKIILAKKICFQQDGATSAMFIGVTDDNKKIVIENCHLMAPPIGIGLPTPCLFGNLISFSDIYYYKAVYFASVNNSYWKIVIK